MDKTQLKHALETAYAIVTSHGIMNHMREYDRKRLPQRIEENDTELRFEFSIDPTRSSYDVGNCNFAINFYYRAGDDFDLEGAIARKYSRRVTLSYGSGEVNLKNVEIRENFIKALTMILEMIEASTPPALTLVVKSAAEVADAKARQQEQLVGERIFLAIGWEGVRGIRKGKNPRVVRLPDNFADLYGAMPDAGTYRYVHVRRMRRGIVKEKADYLFRVVAPATTTRTVVIYRTA